MTDISKEFSDLPSRTYPKGGVVLKQGVLDDVILILESGSVEVRLNQKIIAKISTPGAILGEISVLLNEGHSADVVATSTSTFYVIREASQALAYDTSLSHEISKVLARRLASLSRSFAPSSKDPLMATETPEVRAEVLWDDSDHFGHFLMGTSSPQD